MGSSLKTAAFKKQLLTLARLGCPVDLSLAREDGRYPKLEIERVGEIHESSLFELEDGRVALMAEVALTNHLSRAIDLVDVELRTACVGAQWDWLTTERVTVQGRAKRDFSFNMYRFPGKCGLELEAKLILNNMLFERRRLPAKRRVEGWILGIGGRMPSDLRHGQWVAATLTITTADHSDYTEKLELWAQRLEPRPKTVKPAAGVFAGREKEQTSGSVSSPLSHRVSEARHEGRRSEA